LRGWTDAVYARLGCVPAGLVLCWVYVDDSFLVAGNWDAGESRERSMITGRGDEGGLIESVTYE